MSDKNAEQIKSMVIYKDNNIIVLNKPSGLAVQGGTNTFHHIEAWLPALKYEKEEAPKLVHRIDKDTTGSIIACKNDMAHKEIAAQLKEHSIVRKYRAICAGVIKEDSGTVNAPIGRDEKDRKKMSVNPKNGKEAITHYNVINNNNN